MGSSKTCGGLCPSALAASVTAIAVAMAEGRSADEINLLGAVFMQLGDTLGTIGMQKDLLDKACSSPAEDAH